MKKQLTIICIIGMLFAVGLSGCLEDNTTPLSEEVTVTTNKNGYKLNETVNFTVFNGKNSNIYLSLEFGGFYIDFIERETVSGWVSFWANDPNLIGNCTTGNCTGINIEIKPDESLHLIWKVHRLWFYNESNRAYDCFLVEPGVYRFELEYSTGNFASDIVYSNEFHVEKEKINEVIVTTDKTVYGQNETINITIYNGLNVSIYFYDFFEIEREISGEWQSFFTYCPYPYCVHDMYNPGTEVKSGKSFLFEWIPYIWSNVTHNMSKIEPGVYRIPISYDIREGSSSENQTSYTVYSNEFTITKENDSNYEPVDINNVVITLERTECLGWGGCPIYNLTIYGNGTVVYEGESFVNITGIRTINISEGEVIQLISEFEKIDYFSLNETDIANHFVFDAPTAITSLTINGKTKTIEHYQGAEPIELTELEDKIDEIANSRQWID